MSPPPVFAVYGAPSPDVVDVPPGAVQVSPLTPGSVDLTTLSPGSLEGLVMAAPPGSLERRYAVAAALKALRPDGDLVVAAPKDKGGARLRRELTDFGCAVEETGRRHQRICRCRPGESLQGLDAAIAAGGPSQPAGLGLWSQPGVFSWDRVDPGTALLLACLPPLAGRGADLGCGIGLIALKVLTSPAVASVALVDIDRRAISAAERNVKDPRAEVRWSDVRDDLCLEGLNFVVCNPPFHDGGLEDRALGQTFVRRAREMLKTGGVLFMVANRHLPYEKVLAENFAKVSARAASGGYKILEARR